MYRYCPKCDEWLETAEYTVDEAGETICPEHIAVHGGLQSPGWGGFPVSVEEFHRQNKYLKDHEDELAAARRQGLVE